MSFRTTIILVVILALVAGIAVVYSRKAPSGSSSQPSYWFYQVNSDDIKTINIQLKDKGMTFVEDKDGDWHFGDTSGPAVSTQRWGGITLLLSGPQYKRELLKSPSTLTPYGLDQPQVIINVGLADKRQFQLKIGDKTPDGGSVYAQLGGVESVYLVDSSWGDVLAKLVTTPPYIETPTPVGGAPSGSPTAVPSANQTPAPKPSQSPSAG